MASYISNEPFILDNLGIKYNVIDPKDYSLDFYGDILFTSRKFLEKNPTISRKFYDATKRGWEYAFSNIKESVQIVFEKYNTQNKSLEHLIYEAEALKKLAYNEKGEFGTLSQKRFDEISDIYKLFKLIPPQFNPKKFIDPLGFAKKQVRVGILAKRGLHVTLQRWQRTIDYLNANLAEFYFILQPLDFSQVPLAIEKKEIDFILINPLLYIQMAHKYNISRIATLQTCCDMNTKPIKSFGSVIFTKVESQINSLEELKGKKIAAVDKNSFGGWILGYETLFDHGIKLSDIEVSFSKTHDNVVFDVLLGKVQAGIVRTDTLESMDKNKDIYKKF
jgi:ABC-type nitrate/sulfonate/bicarbonate transport system substrate-binding protein